MLKIKHTFFLFVLFLPIVSSATEFPGKPKHKRSGNGLRINFGTGLNFYNVNEKHADNPRQKMGGTFGFRREVRVVRDYKTYFLFGVDYVLHGVNYQSYYFKPDSVKLYDKKFNYTYSLYMNEIHLPFQMKYLLRREDNSPFSPYILIGYHMRFLLPGHLKVTQDGQLVKEDRPDLKFRTHLFSEKINASLSASLGWQRNNLSDNRGSFFAEINFQYGFSDYYFQSDYSASSMFINCTQVTLLIGSKF